MTEIGAYYDRVASGYQRWWAPVIEPAALRLLDLVAVAVSGRRDPTLVDVGAGTGPLARAAVQRWPHVRAVAVDPSEGMLALGQTIAAAQFDPAIGRRLSWRVGAAECLPVGDGSADALVSSFAFQYLPSRIAALREAYRALAPGGAIAVVTWLASDASFAPWRLFDMVLHELHVERPPSGESGVFRSLPSAGALFRRAGFREVHVKGGTVEYDWTVDALVNCTLESEERELIDSLEDAVRDRLVRAWRDRLSKLPTAELHYRDDVAYVTGIRPAT